MIDAIHQLFFLLSSVGMAFCAVTAFNNQHIGGYSPQEIDSMNPSTS
jgi:hypothetical protein